MPMLPSPSLHGASPSWTARLGALLLVAGPCLAQPLPPHRQYLDQPLPDGTPKIFPLATSPGHFAAERICISPDGKELYYTELNGYTLTSTGRIRCYRFEGDRWTGPHTLFETYGGPAFSAKRDRLLFERWEGGDYRMFESLRTASGWGEPKTLLPGAHYAMETADGRMFLSATRPEGAIGAHDWAERVQKDGQMVLRSLGWPVNQPTQNLDFFIAPDASYLIMARAQEHLFISYRKADGTWTHPKPLITLPGCQTWGPYVTDDGRHLFFSGGHSEADTHVYWVRIDEAIRRERRTNFPPYVSADPGPQNTSTGKAFSFQLPAGTFRDDDGPQTLTYAASLKQGGALPPWLSFDPSSRILRGTPPASGIVTVRITATDPAQASAVLDLDLRTDVVARPVVTRPSDIPDHTYALQGRPSEVLKDPQALQHLVAQIQKAVEGDLQAYDIRDKATQASLHLTLYQVAALRKDRAAVARHLGELRPLLENPVSRDLVGVLVEPCLEALEQPGADVHATIRSLLSRRLATLPEAARGALPGVAQGLLSQTLASVQERVAAHMDGLVKEGRLDEANAGALLNMALNFHLVLPFKEDVAAVLNRPAGSGQQP